MRFIYDSAPFSLIDCLVDSVHMVSTQPGLTLMPGWDPGLKLFLSTASSRPGHN